MTADDAYDGEPVYNAVAAGHPEAAVIIPPRVTAVTGETTATQRDQHVATVAMHGRMGWQRCSGYNRRSLIEIAMFRYKTIIGRRLHAQTLPNQRTEAKTGCGALNWMTPLGMPASTRTNDTHAGRGRCDREILSCTNAPWNECPTADAVDAARCPTDAQGSARGSERNA
jgi:hypothetical protein